MTRKIHDAIKALDLQEQEREAMEKHKKNMEFERQLLEQREEFEKAREHEKAAALESGPTKSSVAAKLPKLSITKFSGKVEDWLPFWGKFKSEIDSSNLAKLTKFGYLKELLEKHVRNDIEGLPFTDDGYDNAKAILEAEYGQPADIVNAYVKNIMELPVITGVNPRKVKEFYKQLRYNVQSLDTLERLGDVKGNVRSTLDKLKGVKADLVRGNEGCYNCTGGKHRADECKSRLRCQKCSRKHHTSICSTRENDFNPLLVAAGKPNARVTYPFVVVEVEGVKCRALLDTGAGSSYASAALLNRISTRKRTKEVRKIEMLLGTSTREVELVTIEIGDVNGKFAMPVEVTKVDKGELLFIDNPNYEETIAKNPHLSGVVMNDQDKKSRLPVHLILGAGEYAKLKTESAPKIGEPGEPVAELTKFGWIIMSPGKEPLDITNMLLTQTSHVDYEELCRLDVLGLSDTPTNDQRNVYTEFQEQLTRDEKGWYENGLPWCGNHPVLPNNREGSLRRLASLNRKLKRQNLTSAYEEIIEEQREAGMVEKADGHCVGDREFYIPHKPVVRATAESTKLRIVYDASARAFDGAPSLNDCLHAGPPLQTLERSR